MAYQNIELQSNFLEELSDEELMTITGGQGETTEIDVLLKDPSVNKVALIKAVRNTTGFSLGDAKNLVESASVTEIREVLSQYEA